MNELLNNAQLQICRWNETSEPDFAGGAVDNHPPANAGDITSIPDLGRLHMPWAAKAHALPRLEPACSRAHGRLCHNILKPVHLESLCSSREATAMSSPHWLQLEKACAQQQMSSATKNKKKINKPRTYRDPSRVPRLESTCFPLLHSLRTVLFGLTYKDMPWDILPIPEKSGF